MLFGVGVFVCLGMPSACFCCFCGLCMCLDVVCFVILVGLIVCGLVYFVVFGVVWWLVLRLPV